MYPAAIRSCALVLALLLAEPLAAQTFHFTTNPQQSTLTADFSLQAQTSGTLIGNFVPVTNPTGTRTKPGIFGSFGDTENLPVGVRVDPSVSGNDLALRSSGGFLLLIDRAANTIRLSDLSADLLAGGPVTLSVNAQVTILEAFRTRNPSSTYIAASANFPLGDATLTALTATQVEGSALGTLTPTGPDTYSFSITPMIVLSGRASFSGTELEAPTTPTALPITGEISFSGDTATLTASADLDIDDTQLPNEPLPPFPFDMPTVLPAGDTAHVILSLTLTEVVTTLSGTQSISAAGTFVPPGDANLDGSIDAADFFALDHGRALQLSGWTNGDFTGDGVIDAQDYAILDRAFLSLHAPPPPGAPAPEPGALGGLVACGTLLLRSRRLQAPAKPA